MQLQPTLSALLSFPYDTLPTPEIWRRSTRPAGWAGCPGPEELFVLPPALDAAYDRAIDAAFEKVMDLFCGPGRKGL